MELNESKVQLIKKAEAVDINYAYQKSVSFSQYQIYKQCPYRWKLQYIDGNYIYEPSMFAVFGTAMHGTLQDYLQVMYDQSIADADRIEIESLFKSHFIAEYEKTMKQNKSTHFSTPVEMREFYDDGINILNHFKKNRGKHFSKKGWELVGIELPIVYPVNDTHKNLYMKGYLDLVMYNKNVNEITIYDIKTSIYGWRDSAKKDQIKTSQLVLYKNYFSQQYDVPVENINVEYFIVKRKLYENCDFPQSRIQTFAPASGKVKQNKLKKSLDNFVNEAFTMEGKYNKDNTFLKTPSKKSCQYCPFSNDKTMCDKKN
jgi:hypothetical protein